ncbi:hypothetical protein KUF83_25390 [Streptomyces sp. BV286]|uniref:hypothetical protein n=1 Tax=Streptomyces sp. BV286 TaxID=2849672 RepID=UPI001C2E5980|nr:hypothetical protein [Streptomyces sp. BV286]MBV1939874.1 hypothetical protein [Streptomyces sp. BV286]
MDTTGVGAPKGAARQGVSSALRSEKFRSNQARHSTPDPTPEQPGIRIYAPPVYRDHWDGARWWNQPGDTPNGAYACACGQTATATGAQNVAALTADYAAHQSICTGTPVPPPERRAAA